MRVLVAYATKYGSTEKCAKLLSEKLNGKVEIINLKEKRDIDLSLYDKVVVGGSIYAGKILKEVIEFCNKNIEVLKEKEIGLFICCMREGDSVEEQMKSAFPVELIGKAVAVSNFGGEFLFKKMNFIDKLITKKIVKIYTDKSNILDDNIENFARLINRS